MYHRDSYKIDRMNKRKSKLVIFFLLFSGIVYAQGIKFSANVGNLVCQTDLFKKQILNGETAFGYEASLFNGFSLSFSIGTNKISFDYYDSSFNQVFNIRSFVVFPLEIRKYYKTDDKNSFFAGIGVSGNYCLSDKREYRNFTYSKIEKKSFTGFNIGLTGTIGYKKNITPNSSIAFSVLIATDLTTNYKNNMDKIRFDKSFFSFSYSIKTLKTMIKCSKRKIK